MPQLQRYEEVKTEKEGCSLTIKFVIFNKTILMRNKRDLNTNSSLWWHTK